MARRRTKPSRAERPVPKQKREEQQRDTLVEDMAANYTCAVEICRDFAGQCELRIDDLEFDLACSKLALEFWSEAPGHAKPVVDAIRQLAAERGRHAAALTDLRERLAALSQNEAIHHHLELPLTHYEKLVRQRLFPDPKPTAGPELRGFR